MKRRSESRSDRARTRAHTVADSAGFTPRNVTTTEERLNTFYVVEVRLPNPDRLLKPGLPPDAVLE
ncbi:MAG: hypothetical protein ACLFV5_12385 [Anaerolineales bacterium]